MHASEAINKPSPDEVLALLKQGNERFAYGRARHPNTGLTRLRLAAQESQADHAYATVISCSDSRVPVERLFDAGVMDIFVICVAGNVCNTDEIGSMEYGLAHVQTPVLVVLGHTQCGAITAAVQAHHKGECTLERNICPLVQSILPAVDRAVESHPDAPEATLLMEAIEQNVWLGIENLFMQSPAVRKLVATGTAKVVGAMYDIGTGHVRWLDESRVADILEKAEANPARATEPFSNLTLA